MLLLFYLSRCLTHLSLFPLEKWIDTESDGTEEVKAAPPPTDMTLGRPSPSQQVDAKGPAAGTGPSANAYSLKRSGRAKYVDVMGKCFLLHALTSISCHLQNM